MESSVAVAPIATENGVEHTENKVSHHKISSKGGWNAAIFIIMVEMAQRFAYYGLAGNLIQYLTNVLNEPTATAAQDVNNWVGISSIFPLLGAFVADSYLGRFNTILLSSFIYFMGMVLLSLAVSVIPLHYRKAVFFTALYILAVGEGGHKPCVQTFAADQFDERNPKDKGAKSSFFNWWYLGIVFGASAAVLVAIYLQDNVGWAVGFGVMAGALALALAIFLIGIKRYRKQAPVGSPFTTVAQVFVAAARKFLDKAMIIDEIDLASRERNPWRLCSLNQVEEVKLVIRLIPIWLSCLMFSCILVQLHTFFTKQGSTMRRSIGSNFQVPPASLQSLVVSICDVFGIVGLQELFYDQMPEAMRSIGAAAYISIIGVGSFINTGVIEVVEAITHRSWLVDNLNRAHLDYFYWVLAGLSALNLCVFIWIAKRFVYKKVLEDESKEEVC
ncbi:protein NRT1/ PTR FAMILY 5.4 [Citrus sinensis]|nr:protein NRT1/ PTR FAMILY 5.4 [Citrus sinensis]